MKEFSMETLTNEEQYLIKGGEGYYVYIMGELFWIEGYDLEADNE